MITWTEEIVEENIAEVDEFLLPSQPTHKQFIEVFRDLFASDKSRYHTFTYVKLERPRRRDDILSALQTLVSKHEALRTTFTFDAKLEMRQVVHSAARIDLIEAGLDPGTNGKFIKDTMAAVHERLYRANFRPGIDHTSRFGLIVSSGLVDAMVIAIHNAVVDGYALDLLRRDLSLAMEGELQVDAKDLWTPTRQAATEHSMVGNRHASRAVAYARSVYGNAPQRTFYSKSGHAPGRIEVSVDSSQLAQSLRSLERDLGFSAASILLAAFASAVAVIARNPKPLISVFYSNRHEKCHAEYVGGLMQQVPVAFDVSRDETLLSLARDAHSKALIAYRHAGYDLADLYEEIFKIECMRGISVRHESWFNYMRGPSRPAGAQGVPADPNPVTVVRDAYEGMPDVVATIWDRENVTGLLLLGNREWVSIADAQRIVTLIISFVGDLAAQKVVRPYYSIVGDPRLATIDNSVVDISAVNRLICSHPDVSSSSVEFSDSSRQRLTATVGVWHNSHLSADELRGFMMSKLPNWPSVICPSDFILKPGASGDRPRPTEVGCESSAKELALIENLFATSVAPNPVSPTQSYLAQGGRVSRIPGLVYELRRLGYWSATSSLLLDHRPLADVFRTISGRRPC